ncbi:MAG TPA: hypothetical protein VNL98_06130 [Gemmatimonadales bacterium]|nr:hypothetical protein [Gemmatimonadales bacterium]
MSCKAVAGALALFASMACGRPGAIAPVPSASLAPQPAQAPRGPLSPRHVGAIQLLSVELPDPGTVIGGQYAGRQFATQRGSIRLTEGSRRRLSTLSVAVAESALAGAGFRVRGPGVPSSDAQPLQGVRFALSGRVSELEVRAVGDVAPIQIEARAEIAWELIDIVAGAAVWGARTRGHVSLSDSLELAVVRALGGAARSLAADTSFLMALGRERPRDLDYLMGSGLPERRIPAGEEPLAIGEQDRNPSPDTVPLARVRSGVVTLHAERQNDVIAIVITADGLAITTSDAARPGRRLFARFESGVERPVRVIRRLRRSRLALVQVSCPDPCATVDWSADGLRGGASVLIVGTPSPGVAGISYGYGEVGGRWGLFNRGLRTLEAGMVLLGGEPLAHPGDGRVVGVVVMRSNVAAALPLSEAFRSLGLRAVN